MTDASPYGSIVVSVVFGSFFFDGTTGDVVVGAVGAFGVLATQVRQSLDNFMSSGQPHDVVGFVWPILGAGKHR